MTLSELRKSCGVTQVDLAAKMGVPQSQLSRIERTDGIRISTLQRYLAGLGAKLVVRVKLGGKVREVSLGTP